MQANSVFDPKRIPGGIVATTPAIPSNLRQRLVKWQGRNLTVATDKDLKQMVASIAADPAHVDHWQCAKLLSNAQAELQRREDALNHTRVDSIRVANGMVRKYTPEPAREPQPHVRAIVGPNNGACAASLSFGYTK